MCIIITNIRNKVNIHKEQIVIVLAVILFLFGTILLICGFFNNRDLFTAAMTSITGATLAYFVYCNIAENNQKASRFYLKKYIEAANMILRRLKSDQPTRRVSWVTAADISDKLDSFEKMISEKSDKDYLEIFRRNYAHDIHEFLYMKKAIYFYGVSEANDLDDAFSKCNFRKAALSVAGEKDKPHSSPTFIEEKHIISVLKPILVLDEAYGNKIINNNNFDSDLVLLDMKYSSIATYVTHLRKKLG